MEKERRKKKKNIVGAALLKHKQWRKFPASVDLKTKPSQCGFAIHTLNSKRRLIKRLYKLSESRFTGFKDFEDKSLIFGERGTDFRHIGNAGRASSQAGG
jgi:hypothetical protein